MTFDPNSRIDSSRVRRRSGGRGAAIGGGGAIGVAIVVFLIAQFTGVDLSGVVDGGTGSGGGTDSAVDCTTGQQANDSVDCLVAGASDSLDTYWSGQVDGYTPPQVILFDDQVDTACGSASSDVGPFYCPADQQIYLDTTFFDELRTTYGSSGGTLAEMYVVAHEWGHHIQYLLGTSDGLDQQATGPKSDSVRLELQADCYAGAWVGAAPDILDDNGTAFLEPVTDVQIADALDAAAAIGDDRLQSEFSDGVDPSTWTHGSSASRQSWFTTGRDGGPTACDTFSVKRP